MNILTFFCVSFFVVACYILIYIFFPAHPKNIGFNLKVNPFNKCMKRKFTVCCFCVFFYCGNCITKSRQIFPFSSSSSLSVEIYKKTIKSTNKTKQKTKFCESEYYNNISLKILFILFFVVLFFDLI